VRFWLQDELVTFTFISRCGVVPLPLICIVIKSVFALGGPGFLKFTVNSVADLELLLMHNRTYAAEIASTVSTRQRKNIVQVCTNYFELFLSAPVNIGCDVFISYTAPFIVVSLIIPHFDILVLVLVLLHVAH
jgi:hypothetical protein